VTRPGRVSGTRLAHLDRLKTGLVAVIIVAHGLLGYCAIDDVWPYQPVREVGLGPITEAVVELAVLPGVLFTIGAVLPRLGAVDPGPARAQGHRPVRPRPLAAARRAARGVGAGAVGIADVRDAPTRW
jgi:hypothetical protein